MSKGKPWSAEEIEELRHCVETMTYYQMAEKFGRPYDAVRKKAKHLNLTKAILNKADSETDMRMFNYSEVHGVRKTIEHFGKTLGEVKEARRRVLKRREKIRQGFTPESLEIFKLTCYKAANLHNMNREAEDFYGWAMIKTLHGRSASPYTLIVDYIRERFGAESESEAKKTREAITHALSISEDFDQEAPGIMVAGPDETMKSNTLHGIANLLELKLIHRVVFLLYFNDGYRQCEIGDIIGVSASRVCQILDILKERLIKNTEAKAMLVE